MRLAMPGRSVTSEYVWALIGLRTAGAVDGRIDDEAKLRTESRWERSPKNRLPEKVFDLDSMPTDFVDGTSFADQGRAFSSFLT